MEANDLALVAQLYGNKHVSKVGLLRSGECMLLYIGFACSLQKKFDTCVKCFSDLPHPLSPQNIGPNCIWLHLGSYDIQSARQSQVYSGCMIVDLLTEVFDFASFDCLLCMHFHSHVLPVDSTNENKVSAKNTGG